MNKKNLFTSLVPIITVLGSLLAIVTFIMTSSENLNLARFFAPIKNGILSFKASKILSALSFTESILLLIVQVFIALKISVMQREKKLCEIERANYNKFKIAIYTISFSWIGIYFWLGVSWLGLDTNLIILNDERFIWSIVDIFHGATVIGFFLAYLRLKYPIRVETEKNRINKILKMNFIKILSIVIGITTLAVIGRFYFSEFDKLGVLLLGILSALSMQYFISELAKIGSEPNKLFFLPLYIYVQLQIIWVAVDGITHVYSQALLIITALICKGFFFYILFRWEKKKRFYNRFKRLHM